MKEIKILKGGMLLMLMFLMWGCKEYEKTMPEFAGSGEMVRVKLQAEAVPKADSMTVTVGKQKAFVGELVGKDVLEFMMPKDLEPGSEKVEVMFGKILMAEAEVEVLPAISNRITFSYKDSTVTILSMVPTGAEATSNTAELGHRISFDLIEGNGNVLHTGSISEPGWNALEAPGDSLQTTFSGELSFSLKVPNIQPAVLYMYYVQPGLDIGSKSGREARQFLNFINMEEEK